MALAIGPLRRATERHQLDDVVEADDDSLVRLLEVDERSQIREVTQTSVSREANDVDLARQPIAIGEQQRRRLRPGDVVAGIVCQGNLALRKMHQDDLRAIVQCHARWSRLGVELERHESLGRIQQLVDPFRPGVIGRRLRQEKNSPARSGRWPT